MSKKSKPQLNTAVIAHYKDGHTEKFNSIEEASENTGVTANSIKIRANKPGATGKDKITFEWQDEYTRRYYMAKRNKGKGNALEYEIVNKLKEIGYSGVCRAAGESKKADNGKLDIIDKNNELPISIQAKNTQNLPNYYTIRDSCVDKTKPFTICWKKAAEGGIASKGTLYLVPDDFFYELLALYKAHH